MSYERPIVLSIAGFDPTGGAGVLADVKTIEQHACLGFSVLSANTVQSESEFLSVNWIDKEEMMAQLDVLFSNYQVAAVKIGIIRSFDVLAEIMAYIKRRSPESSIVWDPVLMSTGGFSLTEQLEPKTLEAILRLCDLVTPNTNEIRLLTNLKDEHQAAERLALFCPVYLKGGHSESEPAVDYLYTGTEKIRFVPKQIRAYSKHGSGCILASAISSNLALGNSLEEACFKAKAYIEKILNTNEHLLSYHHV